MYFFLFGHITCQLTMIGPTMLARVRSEMRVDHTHLNNAGDSPSPAPVLSTYFEVLTRESEIGGYAAASEYASFTQRTRNAAAKIINAEARAKCLGPPS
jgi:selenocysteine lyase/cysteine desulfurase